MDGLPGMVDLDKLLDDFEDEAEKSDSANSQVLAPSASHSSVFTAGDMNRQRAAGAPPLNTQFLTAGAPRINTHVVGAVTNVLESRLAQPLAQSSGYHPEMDVASATSRRDCVVSSVPYSIHSLSRSTHSSVQSQTTYHTVPQAQSAQPTAGAVHQCHRRPLLSIDNSQIDTVYDSRSDAVNNSLLRQKREQTSKVGRHDSGYGTLDLGARLLPPDGERLPAQPCSSDYSSDDAESSSLPCSTTPASLNTFAGTVQYQHISGVPSANAVQSFTHSTRKDINTEAASLPSLAVSDKGSDLLVTEPLMLNSSASHDPSASFTQHVSLTSQNADSTFSDDLSQSHSQKAYTITPAGNISHLTYTESPTVNSQVLPLFPKASTNSLVLPNTKNVHMDVDGEVLGKQTSLIEANQLDNRVRLQQSPQGKPFAETSPHSSDGSFLANVQMSSNGVQSNPDLQTVVPGALESNNTDSSPPEVKVEERGPHSTQQMTEFGIRELRSASSPMCDDQSVESLPLLPADNHRLRSAHMGQVPGADQAVSVQSPMVFDDIKLTLPRERPRSPGDGSEPCSPVAKKSVSVTNAAVDHSLVQAHTVSGESSQLHMSPNKRSTATPGSPKLSVKEDLQPCAPREETTGDSVGVKDGSPLLRQSEGAQLDIRTTGVPSSSTELKTAVGGQLQAANATQLHSAPSHVDRSPSAVQTSLSSERTSFVLEEPAGDSTLQFSAPQTGYLSNCEVPTSFSYVQRPPDGAVGMEGVTTALNFVPNRGHSANAPVSAISHQTGLHVAPVALSEDTSQRPAPIGFGSLEDIEIDDAEFSRLYDSTTVVEFATPSALAASGATDTAATSHQSVLSNASKGTSDILSAVNQDADRVSITSASSLRSYEKLPFLNLVAPPEQSEAAMTPKEDPGVSKIPGMHMKLQATEELPAGCIPPVANVDVAGAIPESSLQSMAALVQGEAAAMRPVSLVPSEVRETFRIARPTTLGMSPTSSFPVAVTPTRPSSLGLAAPKTAKGAAFGAASRPNSLDATPTAGQSSDQSPTVSRPNSLGLSSLQRPSSLGLAPRPTFLKVSPSKESVEAVDDASSDLLASNISQSVGSARDRRPNSLSLSVPGELERSGEEASLPALIAQGPEDTVQTSPAQQRMIVEEAGVEVIELALGTRKPEWVPDAEATACTRCQNKFTFTRRRHHCRACGKLFCSACCSLKARLLYMDNKEGRVCYSCHAALTEGATAAASVSVAPARGVMKKQGSARRAEQKQVTFSDGFRPGAGDASAYPSNPPEARAPKRLDARALGADFSVEENIDMNELLSRLQDEQLPPVVFAVNNNLFVSLKLVQLSCCMGREVWAVSTRGMNTAGQDELLLLLDRAGLSQGQMQEGQPQAEQSLGKAGLPFPQHVFALLHQIYQLAIKGSPLTELSHWPLPAGSPALLGSPDLHGMFFVRPSFQCVQRLPLPAAPYLVALLVQKWEWPWAVACPLRLLLRLGAEFRYYPCPLISVVERPPVYKEVGHTVMNLLCDMRNFRYVLPRIEGASVTLQEQSTLISLPCSSYGQVMRVLSNSDQHVLALGTCLSAEADSHLVCLQADDGSYQTQAINIQSRPRQVTGASFVLFNGDLRSDTGLQAKSSIVEDGLMIHLLPEGMNELRSALQQMRAHEIVCGEPGAEGAERICVRWLSEEAVRDSFYLETSVIDDFPLSSARHVRIHPPQDVQGGSGRALRWNDVYFLSAQRTGEDQALHEPTDEGRLAEQMAAAFCLALSVWLDDLAAAGLLRVALRVSLAPDTVEYLAGGGGQRLPDLYMNSLDEALVPLIHSAAASGAPSVTMEMQFNLVNA